MGLGPGEGETRDKQGMTGAWILSQDTEGQLLLGCWPLPQMFPKHLWKQAQEANSRAKTSPRGNEPSLPPCPAGLQHSEGLPSAGPVASRLRAEVAAATRPGSSWAPCRPRGQLNSGSRIQGLVLGTLTWLGEALGTHRTGARGPPPRSPPTPVQGHLSPGRHDTPGVAGWSPRPSDITCTYVHLFLPLSRTAGLEI